MCVGARESKDRELFRVVVQRDWCCDPKAVVVPAWDAWDCRVRNGNVDVLVFVFSTVVTRPACETARVGFDKVTYRSAVCLAQPDRRTCCISFTKLA